MNLVLVIISLFFLWVIVRSNVQDKVSKRVIYCLILYWIISLAISTFNPLGLYNVSTTTYILLLLNVFAITIGYCTVGESKDYLYPDKRSFCIDEVIKSYSFWIIFIIVFIFGIYTIRNQYAALLYYTAGNLKVDPMGLLFQGSRFKYYFFNLFCTPFYYSCMAIFSYCILYERKYVKSIIALLALIFVYSFIGGGRVTVLFVAFYLLMMYFWGDRIHYSNNDIKAVHLSPKTIILFSIFAILLFGGMVYVTAVGISGISGKLDLDGAYDELLTLFVTYSVGPFRAFDYALQHPDVYFGDYCIGRASLGGLDYLLSLIAGVFGIHFTPVNYSTLTILQDTQIQVGKETSFNYAYTNAMYSYYDFGVLGIIIMGFLFGRFFRRVIKLCYNKSSIAYLILSCFSFYILMHTVFSNYFNKNFTVPLILVLLVLGNLSIKRVKKYRLHGFFNNYSF